MGYKYARTGMAVAVAGVAITGVTLLSGGPAQAGSGPRPQISSCLYKTAKVTAVRKGPGLHFTVVTHLPKGFIIRGSCVERDHHFVRIFDPAKFDGVTIFDRFVFRNDLFMLRGAAQAGGGGTAKAASPFLPATGLGVLTLGGGIALTAWRRRATAMAPNT